MPVINEVLQQGRYRIIRLFEQSGGTGALYEAYDKNLKANVLIKEIAVNFSEAENPAGQESKDRFRPKHHNPSRQKP